MLLTGLGCKHLSIQIQLDYTNLKQHGQQNQEVIFL